MSGVYRRLEAKIKMLRNPVKIFDGLSSSIYWFGKLEDAKKRIMVIGMVMLS